jgi:hypothetical protein
MSMTIAQPARKPVPVGLRLAALLLSAFLAACATSEPAPAPTPPPPQSCPQNLSAAKAKLVTPYDQLAAFIGPEHLERTFTKPVDDMIAAGGGFDHSIAAGERYVQEYKNILANEQATRDEYHSMGKDDAWIDLYLSSVRDGITINQAFVDAARCKQAQAQAQQQQN